MARPKLDMVVEVEDRKSSEGTEMPSKCTVSDMKLRKGLKPRVKINFPSLDLALYLVDYKKADDPDWEEWRNSLWMTIGGHTFGGLLGFGGDNQSAHKHFCRFMGLEEKQEPNWFGKQAMQHGKEMEIVAKHHVLSISKDIIGHVYGSESLLYELCNKHTDFRIGICVTPDIITESTIYEIKCPYYNADKFECPTDFRWDVEARNMKKYGTKINPSWWLQAALYAFITRKQHFTVVICYYTTRTDKYAITYWDCSLTSFVVWSLIYSCIDSIALSAEMYGDMPLKKKYKSARKKQDIVDAISASTELVTHSEVFQKHIDGSVTLVPPCSSIVRPVLWSSEGGSESE